MRVLCSWTASTERLPSQLPHDSSTLARLFVAGIASFSRCAIGLLVDFQVHQLKRILVFTDGSHDQQSSETDINNRWSLVVLAQHLDGHFAPFGGTGASYRQDASLLQSGGSISSGGAEAIVITWALILVITSSPPHIPVEIHTDCMLGLAGTLRGHSCPTHTILLDICASLFQTVRMTRRVSCHHVKGHSGHPWNELADRLAATAARRHWRCSPHPLQQILCICHEHPDAPLRIGPLRWAFLLYAPVSVAASYPTIEDDQLLCPAFITQPCPDYFIPSRTIQPKFTPQFTFESFTVATVNVNTLLPNDTVMEEGLLVPIREITLAKQFLEASFDVVALQETRTRLAGTFRLSGYTAISTDAGSEAYYGAQLWFRLLSQFAVSMAKWRMTAPLFDPNRCS